MHVCTTETLNRRFTFLVNQGSLRICAAYLVTQFCLTLVTPWRVAYQAPLSMEFFQAGILEQVAISSSRDQTHVSCLAGRFFTHWAIGDTHSLRMCVARMFKLVSHAWLFAMPWTVGHQAPLCIGFASKNTGVGCHSLLQSKDRKFQIHEMSNSYIYCTTYFLQFTKLDTIYSLCLLIYNPPWPGTNEAWSR